MEEEKQQEEHQQGREPSCLLYWVTEASLLHWCCSVVASEDKALKHTDGVAHVCCLLQFWGTGAANAFFLSFTSVAFLLFATKITFLMT